MVGTIDCFGHNDAHVLCYLFVLGCAASSREARCSEWHLFDTIGALMTGKKSTIIAVRTVEAVHTPGSVSHEFFVKGLRIRCAQ